MTSESDREKAVELAALKLAVEVAENYARNGSAEALHRVLCKAIAEARAEGMRWVPVSERMPDPRVDVIGYDRFYGKRGSAYTRGDRLIFAHEDDDCDITHWQPMPEPPPPESIGGRR